jgi:hypothetical protein
MLSNHTHVTNKNLAAELTFCKEKHLSARKTLQVNITEEYEPKALVQDSDLMIEQQRKHNRTQKQIL